MLLMGTEGEKQMLQSPCLMGLHDNNKHAKHEDNWMVIMEGGDHEDNNNISSPSSSSSSSLEDSSISNGSTSSSDVVDDASSTSSNSNSPLFELSELMAQLPIKRGLSKYFQGKSQSFTSLSRVTSIEDLAKKETPVRKKIKTCKSYGGGLDNHKSYTLPKATISKKVSRGSFSSLSLPGRRSSFLGSHRPPPIPVQKNF